MNENPMNNATPPADAAAQNSSNMGSTSGNPPADAGNPSASAGDGGAAGSDGGATPPPPDDFGVVDWKQQLPEGWRGELGDAASLEDALAALKRGLAYQPVGDVKELDKAFEGMDVDAAMNADFRKLAVEKGLTADQVSALVKFEAESFAAMERQFVEQATNELKQAWGGEFEAKSNEAMAAMLRFDKAMGGRLSGWLGGADGLKNSPVVMELLAVAGKAISEDSIGGGNSAPTKKTESGEEMFRGIFRNG